MSCIDNDFTDYPSNSSYRYAIGCQVYHDYQSKFHIATLVLFVGRVTLHGIQAATAYA